MRHRYIVSGGNGSAPVKRVQNGQHKGTFVRRKRVYCSLVVPVKRDIILFYK